MVCQPLRGRSHSTDDQKRSSVPPVSHAHPIFFNAWERPGDLRSSDSRPSRLDSPMPHTFAKSRHGIIKFSRADPLVRAGRPRPALFPMHQASDTGEEPAGGPAADEGVRPTPYAGVSWRQKYVALGCPACATTGARAHPTGANNPSRAHGPSRNRPVGSAPGGRFWIRS